MYSRLTQEQKDQLSNIVEPQVGATDPMHASPSLIILSVDAMASTLALGAIYALEPRQRSVLIVNKGSLLFNIGIA